RFAAPPSCPVSMICSNLHSRFTGDSCTRNGRTTSDATGVKPAFTNSLTPSGYSQLARLACCTMGNVTTLITTSPVACIFSNVCLVVLSRTRRDGEKIHIGGRLPKTLKKLNGDKLG